MIKMIIKQKDIVLLSFPFSDMAGSKVRPALIVSNDDFNRKSDDCIMVPLTTVIKNDPYSIILDSSDMLSGKLIQKSRIRVDKIFSVEKRLVIANIGTVKTDLFKKIIKGVESIF